MAQRTFSHYTLELSSGPKLPSTDIWIEYYDDHGCSIGGHGQSLISFACTWKDIAHEVRKGLKLLGLDDDPCTNVSPMVDLT
jgi:hypothetical protein